MRSSRMSVSIPAAAHDIKRIEFRRIENNIDSGTMHSPARPRNCRPVGGSTSRWVGRKVEKQNRKVSSSHDRHLFYLSSDILLATHSRTDSRKLLSPVAFALVLNQLLLFRYEARRPWRFLAIRRRGWFTRNVAAPSSPATIGAVR